MKTFKVMLIGAAVLGVTVAQTAGSAAGGLSHRPGGIAFKRSVDSRLFARAGVAPQFLQGHVECTATAKAGALNTNLDCDTLLPNNEPNIVVDPLNPLHMVASSNDYDSCCDQFYTSFDGGQSWKTGDMSAESKARIGSDPVTAFDPKSGTTIHASLNFLFTSDGQANDGDVVVSLSTDGGVHWGQPVVVGPGLGADKDPLQIFNDKEWIATDTNPSSPHYGRTYLTWTAFRSENGNYVESPIVEAHSDDGGLTWTAPQEISGSSASFCTFQTAGLPSECDEDQASTIAMAPDGTVYVSFLNEQDQAAWEPGDEFEDAYLVVKSTDGGTTWSAPVKAVNLEDGSADYPTNANGRQTLSGYQVRVWGAGNIVASPIDGKLYIAFSDNRAGQHDVAAPVTDSNIYIVSSTDGGATWSAPSPVAASPTDQWFPWVDVNPTNGQVAVIYNQRDPAAPALYNAALAIGAPGAFAVSVVSTKPSHPNESAFFKAQTAGCFRCSVFHGDYIGLDFGSDGTANMVWTDMRKRIPSKKPSYGEFIFFARD